LRNNPLFHGSQRMDHLRWCGVVCNALSRPATGTLHMIGSEKISGTVRRIADLDAEQRCYFLETAMFYLRAGDAAARLAGAHAILPLINGFR
jgi:hypothetical protein